VNGEETERIKLEGSMSRERLKEAVVLGGRRGGGGKRRGWMRKMQPGVCELRGGQKLRGGRSEAEGGERD